MKFKLQKLQLLSFGGILFLILLIALISVLTNSSISTNDYLSSIIYSVVLVALSFVILRPIKIIRGERKKEDLTSYLNEIRVKKELFIDEIMMDYFTKRINEFLLSKVSEPKTDYKMNAGKRALNIKYNYHDKVLEYYFEKNYVEIFYDHQSICYLPYESDGVNRYKKTKKLYDEIINRIEDVMKQNVTKNPESDSK